jgi:phospholipid transport system substrate-binding protein
MKQPSTRIALMPLLVGIFLIVQPSPAASASPRERLDDFFRRATTVLSEARHVSQAQFEIRQLAQPLFDIRGAARRVLEPKWRVLSVVEREKFVRLLGDRLLDGYLSIVRGKLPRDRPPTVRIVGEEVGLGGRTALVRTTIHAKDGADLRFDYVMTKVGANWLVNDVVVDGVSLIRNYRAQVAHVLRVSSYAELLARLSASTAAHGPSSAGRPENRTTARLAIPYPPVQRTASRDMEVP